MLIRTKEMTDEEIKRFYELVKNQFIDVYDEIKVLRKRIEYLENKLSEVMNESN